ncbi:hypothetical protein [Anaerocolumna sp. MB42-C2]|uniref:hypothetical protein n=1 Tax=Anaerocolumna sp. MB42-C2 TaxID=3070997 RepID=UPI0027DF46E5|nr:hypothetical protein [Anaerocolumna sp. MB42-C2]WMJ86838.1 hypothetical protein RBU59_22810 [Anaerocolumna sp. MB42-C2]
MGKTTHSKRKKENVVFEKPVRMIKSRLTMNQVDGSDVELIERKLERLQKLY